MSNSSLIKQRWRHIENEIFEDLPSIFFNEEGLPPSSMPVLPHAERYALWTHQSSGAQNVNVFGMLAPATAAKKSEDAPPLFGYVSDRKQVRLIAAVFDGMGGAGSNLVTNNLKIPVTQAYLASRLCRKFLEKLLWENPEVPLDVKATDLAHVLEGNFLKVEQEIDSQSESRIRGKTDKVLPTTIALVMCESSHQNKWRVKAQWAGDSRAYLLTPNLGLQQITIDDVTEDDPMEQLKSDHKLTNFVSANAPFVIHEKELQVDSQALLIVATDGLFHYLPTPGTLEYIFLDSLRGSEGETARSFASLAQLISRDDVSFVVIALGFRRFEDIALAFRERKRHLASYGYDDLLLNSPSNDLTSTAAENLWQLEKTDYLGLISNYG